MKQFFILCFTCIYCFIARGQTVFTTGTSNCTVGGLLCVGSSCVNPNNASDAIPSSFATINVVFGAACTNKLTSDFAAMQTGGRWTGFLIGGGNLLTLISSLTLTINNTNNSQTQSFTGSSLLTLLTSGRGYLEVQSPFDFNRIEITIAGLTAAALSVNVYFGFSSSLLRAVDLPLSWVSFSGSVSGGRVVLDWITGSENNTSYFNVERSTDGANFLPIGRVAAAGNSAGSTSYRFVDELPVKGRDNYYRIKQVDQDDRYSYSSIIKIRISPGKEFALVVSPDPAKDYINFTLEGVSNNEKLQFEIIDGNGRVVHHEQSMFTGSVFTKSIPRGALSAGIYFYKVTRLANYQSLRGRFMIE